MRRSKSITISLKFVIIFVLIYTMILATPFVWAIVDYKNQLSKQNDMVTRLKTRNEILQELQGKEEEKPSVPPPEQEKER